MSAYCISGGLQSTLYVLSSLYNFSDLPHLAAWGRPSVPSEVYKEPQRLAMPAGQWGFWESQRHLFPCKRCIAAYWPSRLYASYSLHSRNRSSRGFWFSSIDSLNPYLWHFLETFCNLTPDLLTPLKVLMARFIWLSFLKQDFSNCDVSVSHRGSY